MGSALNSEILGSLNLNLPGDKGRQKTIDMVLSENMREDLGEEEILGLSLWKLSDLEPPLLSEEFLYCRTLCRVFRLYHQIRIDSRERALEVLGAADYDNGGAGVEIFKKVKLMYWEQINLLTGDLERLFNNAHKVVAKQKAFKFLCG